MEHGRLNRCVAFEAALAYPLPNRNFCMQALSFLFVRRRGSNDAALRAGECVSTGSTTELMHARAADPRYEHREVF